MGERITVGQRLFTTAVALFAGILMGMIIESQTNLLQSRPQVITKTAASNFNRMGGAESPKCSFDGFMGYRGYRCGGVYAGVANF